MIPPSRIHAQAQQQSTRRQTKRHKNHGDNFKDIDDTSRSLTPLSVTFQRETRNQNNKGHRSNNFFVFVFVFCEVRARQHTVEKGREGQAKQYQKKIKNDF